MHGFWILNLGLVLITSGCRPAACLSADEYLCAEWESYRSAYIHPDGYVFDEHNNGGEVTSEGQRQQRSES